MKIKAKLCILFIFLIFSMLFMPVYASDWTLADTEGRWAVQTRTEWASWWDDDWCFMEWQCTVQNFTAWLIKIDSEIIQDNWIVDTWHYIGIAVEKGGKRYGVSLTNYQHKGINFFGMAFLSVSSCAIRYILGGDEWKTAKTSSLCVDWNVRIYRNSRDELQIQVEGLSGNTVVVAWETKTWVPPDFWTGEMKLIMAMAEETYSLIGSNGQVYGKVLAEQVVVNQGGMDWELGKETEWWNQVVMSVWQWVTTAAQPFKPVVEFLGALWQYLNYARQFLGALFAHASMFIPLLVGLFALWMFLFVIGQIAVGDLYPVYSFLVNLYQFFANVISMVANILQAIYDRIKVW